MRTQVNKIETMYERPNVNVKVEGDSTFTFMLVMCAPYTMSLFLFRYVKFNYAEVEIHLKWDQSASPLLAYGICPGGPLTLRNLVGIWVSNLNRVHFKCQQIGHPRYQRIYLEMVRFVVGRHEQESSEKPETLYNKRAFNSTKIQVWNFGSSTCPMERYVPVAQTRPKPPRVWLLFL